MPPRERRTSDLRATHPAASGHTATSTTSNPPPATTKSQKISVTINPTIIDAAKDAWWATRQASGLTFSAFVEEAMAEHVTREAKRVGVEQFPPRPTQRLPAGRPVQ